MNSHELRAALEGIARQVGEVIAVLGVGPIESAEDAVRAAIVADDE